jgi:hypothetical protein
MGWRVTSKKNHGNIEFNFKNGNIDSKTGSNGAPRTVGPKLKNCVMKIENPKIKKFKILSKITLGSSLEYPINL